MDLRHHLPAHRARAGCTCVRPRRLLTAGRSAGPSPTTWAPIWSTSAVAMARGDARRVGRRGLILHADRGCQYTSAPQLARFARDCITWCARWAAPRCAGTRAWLHSAPPVAGYVETRFLSGLPCLAEGGDRGDRWFVEALILSFALWELSIPALVQLLTVLLCTPSRTASSALVSRPLVRRRSAWLGSLLLRRASSTMRAVKGLPSPER